MAFCFLLGAVGAAGTQQHFQTVLHGVDDGQDILLGCLLAAGEVDDQSTLADACGAAAEAALGGDPHGLGAHGFGDAGGGTLHHRHGSLGGDVSGREAGAAGGQNQGNAQLVGALAQLLLDGLKIIGSKIT